MGKRTYGLKDAYRIAEQKKGKCLSKIYLGLSTMLHWQCKNGHKWKSKFYNIKYNNSWCIQCAIYNHKRSIVDAQGIAQHHGGKCLSKIYIDNKSKLKFKCKNGHKWATTLLSIRNNKHWCPTCASDKNITMEDVQELVKIKNGKCLSKTVKNTKQKLKIQCQKSHKWEVSYSNLKKGTWCPECAGKIVTIKDARYLAKQKGGKCLSRNYKNSVTPLIWECEKGHSWRIAYSNVNANNWCPQCSTGKNEKLCRKLFEKVFKVEFIKIKPIWLINPETGFRLELDGYNERLRIAFEYQGIQHYKKVPYLQRNTTLNTIKKRDNFKKKLCKKHGIKLFIIPYTVKEKDMESYVRNLVQVPANA